MRIPAVTLVVVLTTIITSGQEAPDSTPSSQPTTNVVWHESRALLPTRVILPFGYEGDRAYTLVVALHGYGSTAEAFSRVGKRLARHGFIVALPEAPYAMDVGGKLGYDWTLTHTGDEALEVRAAKLTGGEHLPAVVRDLRERHRIDHVYILGFSQGAIVAVLTGVYKPALFDGIISFGLPYFNLEWFQDDTFEKASGLRVLLVHGEQDQRASIEVSRKAREALRAARYDVVMRKFAGGHSVPGDELDFVAEWLKK